MKRKFVIDFYLIFNVQRIVKYILCECVLVCEKQCRAKMQMRNLLELNFENGWNCRNFSGYFWREVQFKAVYRILVTADDSCNSCGMVFIFRFLRYFRLHSLRAYGHSEHYFRYTHLCTFWSEKKTTIYRAFKRIFASCVAWLMEESAVCPYLGCQLS